MDQKPENQKIQRFDPFCLAIHTAGESSSFSDLTTELGPWPIADDGDCYRPSSPLSSARS